MNKALQRPVDYRIEQAFEDAYNPKNRKFTFGGITVKIPTQAKEEDIKNLCASLFVGGKNVVLHTSLIKIREQLIQDISIKPELNTK